MRKLLQYLLKKPVAWLALRLSSSPRRDQVFESLSALLAGIREHKSGYPPPLPFDMQSGRFIILSDQHKGAKDGADDFRLTEKTYMAALSHYYYEGFTLINLGDCEELWEATPSQVIEKNRATLLEEARFLASN